PAAAAAAKKAFLTTRVGDLGFLLALLWLQNATGTLLLFDDGNGLLETDALNPLSVYLPCGLALSTATGLLLFWGAVGKSGQFPLHVWLPDAMEGPTPVSALIHAATMVAAGVFLVARVFPLMALDQTLAVHTHALTAVALVGSVTALLGALLAVAQNDLKRVLAYSTVSQLGYMMLALGVGAWTAAVFHLLTHAFFKALLFLGAGSVIHAAHHEQDMRALGGLAPRMKLTFATFAVGTCALAGVPFLFSGFWSKEAILHAAHAWDVSALPFYIGLAAVVLTAFYMTRLVAETFSGTPRSPAAGHARENGPVMTVPLVLLAVGAVALGFLNTPAWPWLDATLGGQAAVTPGHLVESPALLAVSAFLVALGIGAGLALYATRKRRRQTASAPDPLQRACPPVFAALQNRLCIDELYAATLGRLNALAAAAADLADRLLVNGAVTLVSRLALCAGIVQRETDEKVLNAGFDGTSSEIRGAGELYSKAQTGEPQGYLHAIAAGFVILALIVILGAR
ncbi:MAG: NADH-quinone oxidoreductase subunit L, partial [Opitutaceae bacterium]|nr:NADH-quinone oxidoreductase subunit L [Opitutaceae bacterium]